MVVNQDVQRILVIRRDNIGDLVCTTPLISALRKKYPAAYLCALVNSYNREVLAHNTDVDKVFWYTKGKHAGSFMGGLGALWARLKLIRRLRQEHFDTIVLAFPGYMARVAKMAGWIGARKVVGYLDGHSDGRISFPVQRNSNDLHETEAVFRLLEPFGITGEPPAAKVVADKAQMAAIRTALGLSNSHKIYGVHISARKPSQKWQIGQFAELIRRIHALEPDAQFVLFWAPGSKFNAQHPGDDENAAELMVKLAGLPVYPCATQTLSELIAGLALCDQVICSDGGGMHLAAGLGKPIVALFGKSDAQHWHPWGVPHVVLQPPSFNVADVSVEQVLAALDSLNGHSDAQTL